MSERAVDSKPVFVVDSCIGGMSVVKSLWDANVANNLVFLADYAVNPLGVKPDSDISDVVANWIEIGSFEADVLIFGCNTLSIRYHQLNPKNASDSQNKQIISMVDCFKAMIQEESQRFKNQRILIIGTAFTATQPIYPELLQAALPGISVKTIAATNLERAIARFQNWDIGDNTIVTKEFRQAIENSDIAILACTCFPMAKSKLESLFPSVHFFDPGEYSANLLADQESGNSKHLTINVSGNVFSKQRVVDFAKSYLEAGAVIV